ncbi:DUF6517 family protein [Haloferax namakaokahaiae]|uniref:DUF6517 family protein n=1 Tax=Haloferax namakaokahaiae TaxID=1748331 RepID=A0ABD5ZGM3_9EURY
MRPTVPLALAAIVVLAGCLGGATTLSAEPATIPASAYESHGYVHGNTTEVPIARDVSVGPASRNVSANVWISGYSKPSNGTDISVLTVISSPNVEVAGQLVNPLATLGSRELITTGLSLLTEAQSFANAPEVNDLREVGTQDVTILGSETELVTYEGTVAVEPGERTVDGEQVQYEGGKATVRIHVATVEHDGDVIVVFALNGADSDDMETIAALATAVEHPGTVEKGT